MKYPCQTVILHTQKRKSLTLVWLFLLLNLLSVICFTNLNKLSLSISPHPLPLEIQKKYIPGRPNTRDWLSIVSNCTMGSFKKLFPYSNFRRRLGQTHFLPKQSHSAIRRKMDPVAHVMQPQNSGYH